MHMVGNKHHANVKSNRKSYEAIFTEKRFRFFTRIFFAATVNQEKGRTFSTDEDMPVNIPPPPATDVATSSQKSVSDSQFFSRNDVLKSEVLWTLKTISSRCSYNSNEIIDKIFRVIFPDGQIYLQIKKNILSLCFWFRRTL